MQRSPAGGAAENSYRLHVEQAVDVMAAYHTGPEDVVVARRGPLEKPVPAALSPRHASRAGRRVRRAHRHRRREKLNTVDPIYCDNERDVWRGLRSIGTVATISLRILVGGRS